MIAFSNVLESHLKGALYYTQRAFMNIAIAPEIEEPYGTNENKPSLWTQRSNGLFGKMRKAYERFSAHT